MLRLTSRPKKIIAKEMLFISKEGLSSYDYSCLVQDNTVMNPFTKESISLYKETPAFIKVPLYSVLGVVKSAEVFEDHRSKGTAVSFKTTTKLRDGQVPVIHDFKKGLEKGVSGFIINAPTAWGKTRACIEMSSIAQTTTLVVVHTTSLLKQWKERLIQHSELTESDIGTIANGKADFYGKKVTIGLVHTLGKINIYEQCRDYFGCIIFDEVDRSVPPETFSSVAEVFCPHIRIGVSATLTRQDEKHIIFQKHIGQIKLVGTFTEGHEKVQQKVIVHKYPRSSGRVYGNNLSATALKGSLCTLLANNQERNALLASYAISGYNTGRKTCIISDRTVQLFYIRQLLVKAGIPDSDIGYYCDTVMEGSIQRKVSAVEKQHALDDAKIILGTYRMMEAGTDIATLALMILGTPLKLVTQTKGRTERPAEKAQPVLVDIVDTAYDKAVKWFAHREQVYVADNMPIKVVQAYSRPNEVLKKVN